MNSDISAILSVRVFHQQSHRYSLKMLFFAVADFTSFFREDEVSIALKLYNHSKDDSVQPTLKMCKSILGTFQLHTFFL